MLGLLAGDAEGGHVDQHQVVVRAARHDPRAALGEGAGQHRRVLDRALLVAPEWLAGGQQEADGLAGDDVHQRPALDAGEDGLVDLGAERGLHHREVGPVDRVGQLFAAEDQAAARAAQGLVGRRGHDVGVREGAGVHAGGHEPGDVRHVHEQQRPDAVGDRRHALEIDDPRVGRGAGHDHLRPHLARGRLEGVVVDPLRLAIDAVRVDLVQPAGEVDRRAVGEVAAVGEVHAQDPVAGLEDAEVGGHVRLRAGVRLDVDVLGAREQGQRPLLGERLGDVHVLAAAVVALAGQALGVLVGEPRALRLHDRGERVVLARDELDLVVLAVALLDHRGPQLGVDLGQRRPAQALPVRDRHAEPALLIARPTRPAVAPRAGSRPGWRGGPPIVP